ncbi:alpha-protein kinase 2 isoform X1 [Nothobranchius furzeri]|uniref:non-specific serine/threonine protein kinase n=2 Tax=Nothobranchius furzeri TaxID=105023 RepID=A0A9D2YDC5_NOTFU|nr:transcript variant X1 [Nothobranchius furzeri]
MGVQDQPLKTKTVPESSSHSDQCCLFLCPGAAGPGLLSVGRSRAIESVYDTTKVDQKLPPMGSLGVAVVSSGGHTEDVSLIRASFYDGDLETFEEEVCINKEDYPVTLKITEDMDLIPQTKLFDEETFGDGVCPLTHDSSQQRSDESPTGLFGASDSDLHTNESFQNFPDLLEERQLASPDSIMCLAPLGIDSSGVCQTNSCLKGDQSQNTSDHVQHRPPHPASDGITDQPFLESEEELIQKKQKTINTGEESSPDGLKEQNSEKSCFLVDLSGDLANYPPFSTDFIVVSETDPVAYITLGLNDPFIPWAAKPFFTESEELKMPHKTTKNPAESKTRSKKDKPGHHHITQPKKQDSHHVCIQESCKQQESHPPTGEHRISELHEAGAEVKEDKPVNETGVEVTEKGLSKPHGKKKKKHVATVKIEDETPADLGGGAKPKSTKGRVDMFEAKLGTKTGTAQPVAAQKKSKQPDDKIPQGEKAHTDHKDHSAKTFTASANDDSVKRRRMSGDKCGKIVCSLESKLPKTGGLIKTKEESQGSAARKKAYSEVVKEKIPPKEEPQVVQVIQAVPVSEDPQSLRLCCQFAAVHSDCTVTWSKEGLALIQIKRSAGDDSRVSLTITNASHKDLGRYECQLSCSQGSASLGYLLTYEVLSEIVIPASPRSITSPSVEVSREEEDAHYSKLHFKEDFLSDQYFGENLPISILTEKVHFGEGMHRRAFRTTLKEGQVPLLVPGHSCVLKVHNAISYGTKNNDELIQRNFSLAVEECQVQNTAREYIKAYTSAARSVEAFGDIPEIIPIYLVHRPSNDIPYATLEEELIGDFVKYSVKDGKEINLMRRDSEAGQKCCAFQHWVYQNTEGNLLVTDMQGVGMKLTDVGIATCKKGYKGFKGNCATSFIDQFKVLHQCNSFCEILGLRSLQPKAKKTSAAPKPKAQPSAVPKKKTFGPTAKGKS